MDIYAIIDSNTNICSNMIYLSPDSIWSCPEEHYMVEDNERLGSIGQTYDNFNKIWIPLLPPEPKPLPVPQSITRRQCSLGLLNLELITPEEALSMTRNGVPPSLVMTYIETLPTDQQIRAEIDFAADNYYRNNELLIAMMTANGYTSEEIDNFFRNSSKL